MLCYKWKTVAVYVQVSQRYPRLGARGLPLWWRRWRLFSRGLYSSMSRYFFHKPWFFPLFSCFFGLSRRPPYFTFFKEKNLSLFFSQFFLYFSPVFFPILLFFPTPWESRLLKNIWPWQIVLRLSPARKDGKCIRFGLKRIPAFQFLLIFIFWGLFSRENELFMRFGRLQGRLIFCPSVITEKNRVGNLSRQ